MHTPHYSPRVKQWSRNGGVSHRKKKCDCDDDHSSFFFFRWTANGCQSFQFIEARFRAPTAYEITCRYGDRSSHNFPLLWTFAGSRAIAVAVEGRVEGEFHFSFFFFCGSDFLEILFWHNFSSFWGWDVDGVDDQTGHDTKVTVTCGYVYNTSVYFFLFRWDRNDLSRQFSLGSAFRVVFVPQVAAGFVYIVEVATGSGVWNLCDRGWVGQ